MRDLARPELDISRPQAGSLSSVVQFVLAAAVVVTIVIALAVPKLLLDLEGLRAPVGVTLALGAFVVAVMIAAALARSSVSIGARIAVALPIAHLVMMVAMAVVWVVLGPRLAVAHSLVPLVDAVPLGAIVGAALAITLGAAVLIARPRRREALQVAVTIALVQLLLLGAWLPIASAYGAKTFGFTHNWIKPEVMFASVENPGGLVAFALVPPLGLAILYAAIATRRARWMHGIHVTGGTVLGIAFLMAFTARSNASSTALTIYLNFLPWLLAAAGVAVAMIVLSCGGSLLAAVRLRRATAPDRRQFTGTIAGTKADVIAAVVVRSWLRAPELVVEGFEVTTADGAVPVPPGAILAAPLPLATTALHAGEALAVVHGGTAVALAGFDAPADGSPFRRSLAPTATGPVVVAPAPAPPTDAFAQVALAAWRPSVMYLLFFVAAALPALAGLSST